LTSNANSRIADAELETIEHAGEVVRVPAVTEYQGDGDRLRVLAGAKVARCRSEQFLKMVVDVQLLEDSPDQRPCPSDSLRRGDRSAN
jgi:hypothetical protein